MLAEAEMSEKTQATPRPLNGAEYLDSLLREIPGIKPQKTYPGCTRHNHHTYVFRYLKEQFAGMPKPMLLKALNYRDTLPLLQLVERIVEGGRNSINHISETMCHAATGR